MPGELRGDELFDARLALLVGNYEKAIAEANGASSSYVAASQKEEVKVEKTAIIALAQAGLANFGAARAELGKASHPLLAGVRRYVAFVEALKAHPATQDSVDADVMVLVDELKDAAETQLAEDASLERSFSTTFAAAALIDVKRYAEALTLGHQWLRQLTGRTSTATTTAARAPQEEQRILELHALMAEGLLGMQCIDEARAEAAAMLALNEDAMLTVLYDGITSLYMAQLHLDAELYKHALECFQNVTMQCGQSARVLNLTALAYMGLQNYAAAEQVLLDALALRANEENTTANIAAVSAQLGKSVETSERYARQARQAHSAWGEQYAQISQAIDDAVSGFQAA